MKKVFSTLLQTRTFFFANVILIVASLLLYQSEHAEELCRVTNYVKNAVHSSSSYLMEQRSKYLEHCMTFTYIEPLLKIRSKEAKTINTAVKLKSRYVTEATSK